MKKADDKTQKKKLKIIRTMVFLFPKFFKHIPWLLALYLVISVMHGISFAITVPLKQNFFDTALAFSEGDALLETVFVSLAVMGAGYLISQALNGIGNYMPNVLSGIVGGRLKKEMHVKMSRLKGEFYEDTEKLDSINRADMGRESAFWMMLIFLNIFTFYLPYFAFMGWYLFSLKPVLILALVLAFVPVALSQIARARIFSNVEDKAAPVRRELDYYQICILDRGCYKETRLLGGFNYFKRLFMRTLKLIQQINYKAAVKSGLFELGANLGTVAGYFIVLWMLFEAVMAGEISVGAFAAVFSSIGTLYGIMDEVVRRHIGSFAQNAGAVRNYIDFLEMPVRGGIVADIPQKCGIELKDVSFSYPQSEIQAVKNVNLTVRPGETLALVGENGSGKSTLVRLMTGIYLPESGKVEVGGQDTAKTDIRSLCAHTSAVFQQYLRYQLTLRQNVGISQTDRPAEDEKVKAACEQAGLRLLDEEIPQGYDTMLSREFDGVDLSGGQWQRVAIARGLFREHGFIVLDEPTAAIDPIEETRLYNRFAEIAKDKTAVIVTHRLGSVRLADRIAVMKEGVLVQLGTHEELLACPDGEYARLYRAQEQWYKNKPECV